MLLVRLACLVRFQARVRLQDHAWYFRLLSRSCWCPIRPNFGRTQARHLPGSPTQSETFFCQVHVWLMFDSENGIPARVRLDSVSVWFKNFDLRERGVHIPARACNSHTKARHFDRPIDFYLVICLWKFINFLSAWVHILNTAYFDQAFSVS